MDKSILIRLCEAHNITIAELEKTLGMSNGSLRKDGDIKSQRLKAIADYFNVSMEYLMGQNVAPVQLPGFDDFEMGLIKDFNNADENTQKMIIELLAFSKKMKKEQNEED